MLWFQACLCFVAWIAYGVWLAKSPRAKRLLTIKIRGLWVGPLLFVLSMVLLTGTLYAIGTSGGLVNGSLRPWAFALTLVVGMVFVHAQCLGALSLFRSTASPETSQNHQTSVRTEDSP